MDFDFTSIRNRMITSLQSKASWANILFFSTNQRLIDIVAEEVSELAKYVDYQTREAKWTLAQNRSSLVTQAQLLGYQPHRKVGAIGQIRLSVDSGFAAPPSPVNVPIPQWSVFSDGGEIQVTNPQGSVITTTDNFIDLDIVQGTPKSITFTANGDIYEELVVDNTSFEDVYYEVLVNSVLWTEIDDLREAESGTSQVFEVQNKVDFSGVIFRFGNNTFGKKLNNGDSVVIRYVETLGAGGNISSIGIINTVESTIRDLNNDVTEVFVTNLSAIDGGLAEEDIEDIRTFGPNVFQTAERASSSTDYISLFRANALVANANVWGAYEVNLDAGTPGAFIPSEENVVHVAGYTAGGNNFDSGQQDTLRAYINPFKPPTDIIQFENTEFIEVIFNVDAFIRDRSVVLQTVKNDIITALSTQYALDNRDFNQNLNQSDYQKFIDDQLPSDRDYHNTNVVLFKLSSFNTAYEATLTIPLFPLETGTIKVYVKLPADPDYTLIGTDDSAGGFTAEPGYDLTGSSINYSTGEGTLIVISGLAGAFADYTIRTEYETLESQFKNNIVIISREQIIRYAEANVTVQYTT